MSESEDLVEGLRRTIERMVVDNRQAQDRLRYLADKASALLDHVDGLNIDPESCFGGCIADLREDVEILLSERR